MPAYFKGSDTYSIDNKNRVAIPAKMRKLLTPESNETFIVTRGFDKCIMAFPLDEWEEYSKNLMELNQAKKSERWIINVMNMYMDEIQMDAQQRVMLPKNLLEFAGIKDKIRIVGMINYIALWNPDEHDAYIKKMEEEQPYEDAIQAVMDKKSL